jgi:hypothetical protein
VELKSLLFENVECDCMGYWFSFSRSKQRNKLEETTICVPRRQPDWLPCTEDSGRRPVDYDPASVIDSYFEAVVQDLDCKREDLKGCFFKGTHGKSGKRFVKANIGKNTIALVGVEVASELCLRDPETFTGHCWRRSAGTNASNAGVNVTTLMSMMGWACPKTAMQYVKRSRITSLQMSMYLANVQRRNCSDPFPSGNVRVSRKSKFRSEQKLASFLTVPNVQGVEQVNCENKTHREKNTVGSLESFKNNCAVPTFSQEIEKFESQVSTQDLLCENAEKSVVSCSNVLITESALICCTSNALPTAVVSSVQAPVSSSIDLTSVDSRLAQFLQNFQNHGTVQIHFNFGDVKK